MKYGGCSFFFLYESFSFFFSLDEKKEKRETEVVKEEATPRFFSLDGGDKIFMCSYLSFSLCIQGWVHKLVTCFLVCY